jgi:HTH-type transcriptional regulator/antitoxin HipB
MTVKNMDISEISHIVKFHRKISKLTQEELARIAGVGKTVIYDLEKGKSTIQFSTLKKILNALNIKMEFNSKLMKAYYEQMNKENINAKS